ncbi:hypothetical protein [Leeuwenhoekiella parthenopeia]|uniref:hypothetical protein n=1 Tax=Leeuwenhoekiella parthenopeia TaxID=2890320 RepID=UPI001D18852B|nr:hypothetical protein [Leeuwenhoekiella parthenopeia]
MGKVNLLRTALYSYFRTVQTNPTEIEFNVADVIGIAIKLLPFSEMQFIDETMELLSEESSTHTER